MSNTRSCPDRRLACWRAVIGCSPFTVELNALDSTGITTPSSFNRTTDTAARPARMPTAPTRGRPTGGHPVLRRHRGSRPRWCEHRPADRRGRTIPFVQTDGGEVCSGNPFLFEGNAFNLDDNFEPVAGSGPGLVAGGGGLRRHQRFRRLRVDLRQPGLASDTVSIAVTVTPAQRMLDRNASGLCVRPSYAPFVEDADGCVPFAVGTPPKVALEVQWDFGDMGNPNAPGPRLKPTPNPAPTRWWPRGSPCSAVLDRIPPRSSSTHPPTPALTAEDALCAPTR